MKSCFHDQLYCLKIFQAVLLAQNRFQNNWKSVLWLEKHFLGSPPPLYAMLGPCPWNFTWYCSMIWFSFGCLAISTTHTSIVVACCRRIIFVQIQMFNPIRGIDLVCSTTEATSHVQNQSFVIIGNISFCKKSQKKLC